MRIPILTGLHRFGRWREWVEKRYPLINPGVGLRIHSILHSAAERYLDDDGDIRLRRKERGWGDSVMNASPYSLALM